MDYQPGSPFDSIESAHDFVRILSLVVKETRQEIDTDIKRESDLKVPRRLDALRLASYNLDKLELHMNKSCRILNDLRSLRRLLFEERKIAGVVSVKPKAAVVPKPEVVAAVLPPPEATRTHVTDERVAAA